MNPIEFLHASILEKVKTENYVESVDINPTELSHRELRAAGLVDEGVKSKALNVASTNSDYPSAGLSIGSRTILIGSLADSTLPSPSNEALRDPVLARWREYQRRCAIARSWLAEDRSDDLMLFLAGPAGSGLDPYWKALAGQMERNDLVCRKLVWLPPLAPNEWRESLVTFFRRTFLARPWLGETTVAQRPLDMLSDTGAMLVAWQALLDKQPSERGDIDYDALVAKLIKGFKP